MKKLFVLILAVIYLSEASGMGLHLHYCMDKLVSWGVTKNHKCLSFNSSKHHLSHLACKNCCKDEYKTAKLDNSKKAELGFLLIAQPVKVNGLFAFQESPIVASLKAIGSNHINAPPKKYKVSVFVFNGVFRI
jgi:hypothetical protein